MFFAIYDLFRIFLDLASFSLVWQMWCISSFCYCLLFGFGIYALSRHRCCFLFLPVFVLRDEICLLATALSTTPVTNLTSCVLADDMTAESGIPSLSVKICLFVPSLPLLSVGLLPRSSPPPKATLSICCNKGLLPGPLDSYLVIINFEQPYPYFPKNVKFNPLLKSPVAC